MERRYTTIPQQVRLDRRADGDTSGLPSITGLASVFYNPNDPGTEFTLFDESPDGGYCMVERIMPTAFDDVLRRGMDVLALHNHDMNRLLGQLSARTLELQRTAAGLRYRIAPPATELGREVVESVRRRDLSGSSFSFDCRDDGCKLIRQGKTVIREIHSVCYLGDVGPVATPAYTATTTNTARLAETVATVATTGRMTPGMIDAINARVRLAQLGL